MREGTSVLFDLSGITALVTGANSGLGLAMARGLVRAGADVVIWGRDEAKNAAAEEQLRSLGHGRTTSFVADVSEESQIEAAMDASVGFLGKLDCCFANAGRSGCRSGLDDLEAAGWDAVQAVNTRGVALTYKHASRQMIAQGTGGKLVATSSGQSIMGVNRSADYAASKAAVNGLTRAAAYELARYGITANALLFGYYGTDLTADADPKFGEWILKRVPLRRPGDLAGVEGLAVFFASFASDYITGQCLPVDGGLCIS